MVLRYRIAHVGTLLLAVALGSTALATCVTPETTPQPQMTCCPPGHHDCGTAVQPADCCRIHQAVDERLIALKTDARSLGAVALRPVAGPVTAAFAPPSLPVVDARAARARAPSPPVYVLTSAYLI
jgi:hypothetical protein